MRQTKQKKRKLILSDKKKTRRRQQQKGGFPFGIAPVVVQDKNNHFMDFQVDSNTIDRGLYAKKHHYFPLMRRAKMPGDFDFKNVYDKTYNFFHREPKKLKIKTVKIAANTDEDIEKMKVLNKIVRHLRKNQDVVGGMKLSEYEKTLLSEMGLDELGVKEMLLKKEGEKKETAKDIDQMYLEESEKNRLLEAKLSQFVRMYGAIEDESSLEFDPDKFSSLDEMKLEAPKSSKDESTIKLEKKLEDLENKVASMSSTSSNLQASTSGLPAPTSDLQAPTSGLPAPTSGLPAPTSGLPAPTSGLPAQTSGLQAPTSGLQAPTSDLQAPTSGLQAPTSNLQASTSGLPAPTSGLPASTKTSSENLKIETK
jgi:hypothetical protein